MNLKWYYWYFQSVIPKRICDDIVRYGKEQDKEIALTGNANKDKLTELELKNIQKKRKSDVVWMSDKWIYKEIQPYIHQANANASWNFEWDWSESCQFTEYKKGQFYDWHCDSYEEPYNNPENRNTHGKLRKLSMTVSLTDPEEYEGGDGHSHRHGAEKKEHGHGHSHGGGEKKEHGHGHGHGSAVATVWRWSLQRAQNGA